MKWLIGVFVAFILAVAIWSTWFVNDFNKMRLNFGAGDAIAAEAEDASSPSFTDSELNEMLKNKFIGAKDAPTSVLVFSSFTCTHCKQFHKKVFSVLKEKYKDSKDVALYLIDFPLEIRAASASMLTHCLPEKSYWQFADIVFANQDSWMMADNYDDILLNYASLSGFPIDKGRACIKSKPFLKKLLAKRDAAAVKYNIQGTPSIIVEKEGKAKIIPLGGKAEDFISAIDKSVKETEKK